MQKMHFGHFCWLQQANEWASQTGLGIALILVRTRAQESAMDDCSEDGIKNLMETLSILDGIVVTPERIQQNSVCEVGKSGRVLFYY